MWMTCSVLTILNAIKSLYYTIYTYDVPVCFRSVDRILSLQIRWCASTPCRPTTCIQNIIKTFLYMILTVLRKIKGISFVISNTSVQYVIKLKLVITSPGWHSVTRVHIRGCATFLHWRHVRPSVKSTKWTYTHIILFRGTLSLAIMFSNIV